MVEIVRLDKIEYVVTNKNGKEIKFKDITEVATAYHIYAFDSFENFQKQLKEKRKVDLQRYDGVDKREQAIYKRLCGIKRPKPKVVKFKKGDLVECIGTSDGRDGDKTYGGGGWSLGKRFYVEDISEYKGYDICWYGGSKGVYVHHLKLISRGGG